MMALVFSYQLDTGMQTGWYMVNTGWRSKLKPTGFAAESVQQSVGVVSYTGVVDLPVDLIGAPLTFKKISTLGNISVGDGFHADYFLTAYDPNVPGALFIRSSVDPTRMWKRMVAAQ
jgi:hypothetical protein